MGKYKQIFVSPRSNKNRIELDPVSSIDRNPLPAYTYGAGANETFPGIFPTARGVAGTRGPIEIHKEGMGVAADVSTPTFSSTSGGKDSKEMDFFNTKTKIDKFVKKHWGLDKMTDNNVQKAWVWYSPRTGSNTPPPLPREINVRAEKEGFKIQTRMGQKGAWYYQSYVPRKGQKATSLLPQRKYEESKEMREQVFIKPKGNYSLSGVVIPSTWHSCLVNEDEKSPLQIIGVDNYNEFVMARDKKWEDVGVFKHFVMLKRLVKSGDLKKITGRLAKDVNNRKLNPVARQASLIYWTQLQTGFRFGSYTKTKGKVPSVGISTLRGKNVRINTKGDVGFDFRGKDGNLHTERIHNTALSNYIREWKTTHGNDERLFPDISHKRAQKYLDRICIEEGCRLGKKKNGKLNVHYTSHDFRRYRASKRAIEEINQWLKEGNKRPETQEELNALKIRIGNKVGQSVLRNTYTVALEKYITPLVWERFKVPSKTELIGKAKTTNTQGVSHLNYKNLSYKKPRKEQEGRSIINSMDFVSKADGGGDEFWTSLEDMLEHITYDTNKEENNNEEQNSPESSKPSLEDIKSQINKMLEVE